MTTDPAIATPVSKIDVKPLVNRNQDNVTNKMEALRDQVYDFFQQACAAEGVDAVILKSYPFTVPAWVTFQCWVRRSPEEQLTDRSTATVTIVPREFHQYEHVINLEIEEGSKKKKYLSIVELDQANVTALVRYMLRRTRFDIFGFKHVRARWWELWLPGNNVTRLKKDWLGLSVPILLLVGVLAFLAVPTLGFLIDLIGTTYSLRMFYNFFFVVLPMFGFFLLALAIGLTIYTRLRKTYFLSPGKPPLEPRRLLRMDSWQALVRDIGAEGPNVKDLVKRELAVCPIEGVHFGDEKIWYSGIDGPEEREQLVVTFRRAIGFIHIYSYGKDLYVGWDAHLNAGTWIEKQVAAGLEPQTGEYCRVNTIEGGWHVPSEYDITDANCLIEWIHAAVTKVTKLTLAEYKIDQEIDFKILRGERSRVVGTRAPEEDDGKSGASGFMSRFKREA
ncbi:MAG TPA: hypothetical protein VLL54_13875 [Pyrinomonadaceae bacterium]|nr:hypothetical protein [Pyrinomonadaceae bacterium]